MMGEQTWQQALREVVSDPVELGEALGLDSEVVAKMQRAAVEFPLRVPRAFLARMEKGNPDDPLLRQVLPLGIELQTLPGYSKDPLKESTFNPAPGLLHKYPSRVLFTLTGTCAVNCRYCFRRHYPYEEKVPGLSQWQAALDYIMGDPSIEEIILSGGDPLVVKDQSLAALLTKLEKIPHLKRLRIHTRLPIMIPERITDELVDMLLKTRLQSVIVFHSNHANELDERVAKAMERCNGIPLLNQSVLLKGVNDSVEALVQLSERLFEMGVLPYYLHLLDPVAGAAHFDVSEERAKTLMQKMTNRVSGYLVPRLVREVPGMLAKQVLR